MREEPGRSLKIGNLVLRTMTKALQRVNPLATSGQYKRCSGIRIHEPGIIHGPNEVSAPALRVLAAPMLSLTMLAGCTSLLTETTSAGAGVAAAGISRAVTKDPAVVTGIGLGVQAAARAGLQYTERKVHQAEQDSIAAIAGALPVGGVAPWRVVHDLPIEANEHGEVTVSRTLGGADIACKEIVFSVDGKERAFYMATICRDGTVWKWATAEPATERWGALQ